MTLQRCAVVAFALVSAAALAGQLGGDPVDLNHSAIGYRTIASTDRVAQLNRRLTSGETALAFEDRTGYVRPLLAALDVPVESQMFVYSKTSLQKGLIYSEAFDALPAGVRGTIYARLKEILAGNTRASKYAHLAAADRQAVLEILRDTKKNLPAGF